ncbi:predicted protein [Botrytis cinerea T4]|uniref:Uncharacterized protein n=1 Tax=Botryotinia fuckeliana (strain T4) TaxID=999810 RepID=G2Y948_BOTF4|nr:predicted protein [Botrytis cinerea T4]
MPLQMISGNIFMRIIKVYHSEHDYHVKLSSDSPAAKAYHSFTPLTINPINERPVVVSSMIPLSPP